MSNWRNRTYKQDHVEEKEVPFAIWTRGEMKPKRPKESHFGFWEFKNARWGTFFGSTEQRLDLPGRTSNFLPELNIAVMGWVKLWYLRGENNFPFYVPNWQPGARGNVRVIGYVKELWDRGYQDLIFLSLSGMNCKHWEASYKIYQQNVFAKAEAEMMSAAKEAGTQDLGPVRLPPYVFWTKMGPGDDQIEGKTKGGETYYVTPPFCQYNEEPLDDLAVPDDILTVCENSFERVSEWLTFQENRHLMQGETSSADGSGDDYDPNL